ncbi:MAG: Ppx/GppA family phosphatase [Acidobacteria bacterium]|nr:Ppx/GppA family phosphatase [Acidobacteriota bacterium]
MLTADVLPSGKFEVLASQREVTRLGESVFRAGEISAQASDFVCSMLTRMGAEFRKLDPMGVRAVATAAVRDASNQREFLARASDALGAPVEIVSGQEEARLIHLGVEAVWPHPDQRIMIVDVGGGSAEIIVAEDGHVVEAVSKPLGAVRLTGLFLKADPPEPGDITRLDDYIEERLAPVVRRIGVKPCARAIATSSTAAALVCAVNRIPRVRRDDADRLRAPLAQVRKLYKDLCRRDTAGRVKVPGIGPRRAQIIVPGIAVLLQCMERFHLPSLYYSTAGVREGLIADLAARRVGAERTQLTQDTRREVERMASKFQVPLRRARHVAGLARVLFESLRSLHGLAPGWGRLLEAAAYLFDTGHFVSDTGHHKHSEYLVANSDLPGFTGRERTLIAVLCRFHRKALPSARHTTFQQLPADDRRALLFLIPLLRLADALDRGHEQRITSITCQVGASAIEIRLQSAQSADLEVWAAQRTADAFAAVYQKSLAASQA